MAKKSKFESIKDSLWNSQAKTFLGRTGDSWLKLIAFYIVLYTCLASIWSIFFYIFQLTISDKYPKWQLNESLIGSNPGLGVRPRNSHVDSALIRYTIGTDSDSTEQYIADLNKFIHPFENSTNSNCEQSSSLDTFCLFDTKVLPAECTSAQNYSFNIGKPCILVKLNRIYGWKPEPFEEKPPDFPQDVPFVANAIQITCDGQHDEDKEHVGSIEYFPNGIESKYYPFFNQEEYKSPFVMAQFKNPKLDTLIHVECKAWAKNIHQDRVTKGGLVVFELFIESSKKQNQEH